MLINGLLGPLFEDGRFEVCQASYEAKGILLICDIGGPYQRDTRLYPGSFDYSSPGVDGLLACPVLMSRDIIRVDPNRGGQGRDVLLLPKAQSADQCSEVSHSGFVPNSSHICFANRVPSGEKRRTLGT